MSEETLKPGDVVQIDPATAEQGGFFGGCFMLVTEVKSWGARGFICMPQERGQLPDRAYYRAKTAEMVRVGHAEWIPADEAP